MRRTRSRRTQAGMTMLDCLLAIGLLTIGAVGLLGMELVALGANQLARNLEQATRLAEEQMEALSYATATPVSGSDAIDGAGCPGGARCQQVGLVFQRSWVVGSGTPTTLRVTVAWTD